MGGKSIPGQVRASGATQAEEVREEVSAEADQTIEPRLPEESARKFALPGFSRMRLEWTPEDARVIQRARAAVDGVFNRNFADALAIMHDLFEIVREPVIDPSTSEPKRDKWGWIEWQRTASGDYVEDFGKLTRAQKENFLFRITTRLFAWEQRSADAWGEAMFAKAQWEERFAIEYDRPAVGTIDDRRAVGNKGSAEERYFAIFLTLYSRKAEAIVRTMGLLGQRLKDSLEF